MNLTFGFGTHPERSDIAFEDDTPSGVHFYLPRALDLRIGHRDQYRLHGLDRRPGGDGGRDVWEGSRTTGALPRAFFREIGLASRALGGVWADFFMLWCATDASVELSQQAAAGYNI